MIEVSALGVRVIVSARVIVASMARQTVTDHPANPAL
jgi:hypothetical protein